MPDIQYNEKIRNYLASHNLVNPSILDEALSAANKGKRTIEEELTERNVFNRDELLKIKGGIFNLPVADLAVSQIKPEILNLLSQKVAENYKAIVFAQKDKQVSIGLVDPGDFMANEAIEFWAKTSGFQISYFVILLEDFRRFIKNYSGFTKEIGTALQSAEEKYAEKEDELILEGGAALEEKIKAAPVAKIVSVIIRHGIEGNASDIHIEPGRSESRVRYRVDGILHTSLTLPTYIHNAVVSRIKVMANLKLDETRLPQDGRIRSQIDGQEVDLRISVLPMLNSEKVVIRVLDTSAGVPNLSQLGFLDNEVELLNQNANKPFGLILLTGPTGSGKTTTLYSILNQIKTENSNVTTLEDPIEYSIAGINQSQINPDVGFTFASGLRAILRQDPNVIMVGEIRDSETAELVIHAGLTGHLVFSTLHTNNAWGAIPRMIDMKAEPFLLSSTLNLIMAQRLVRKICSSCRQEVSLPGPLLKQVESEIQQIPPELLKRYAPQAKFYRAVGCDLCGKSGFVGRTVISEIIAITPELRELIAKENFSNEAVIAELKKQNFVTLMQDGIMKSMMGLTTIEEVMQVTQM
ncbi:MAG: GspE/PulE family protein [Candidatus Buchananbacteria bacterium]